MAVEKNTTYRVSWSDYFGRECRLDIIDTETVSPIVHVLDPGTSPFVTKISDDEEPLKALRSGSGVICVVANYDVMQLFDFTSTHRYRVVAYRSEEVFWQGWLKGESLSQKYESAVSEFSLNCIDDIEALGCWDMTQENTVINGVEFSGDFSLTSVSRMLSEIFSHVSGVCETPALTFYFPLQSESELWQLSAFFSRGLFFDSVSYDCETEAEDASKLYEGKTCKDALEIICTFFGWSCQAVGSNIFFSASSFIMDYAQLSFDKLASGSLDFEKKSVSDASLYSMGEHEISQFPGVHKINVKAELTKNSELLPSFEDYMDFVVDEGTVERNLTVRALTYKSNSGRISLHGYEMTSEEDSPKSPSDYTITSVDFGSSAYFNEKWPGFNGSNFSRVGKMISGFTKEDSFVEDDTKKNYDFKIGFGFNIFYPVYSTSSGWITITPSRNVRSQLPLVIITGEQVALTGGALSFNANIASMDHNKTTDSWLISSLLISIKIGDYYYDKSNACWTTSKAVIDAPLDDSLGASVNDEKTLDMPYNGASGMIIPIDRMLSGVVELCIYPPILYKDSVYLVWRRFIIFGMSLKHHDTDSNLAKSLPDHYNYTKYSDLWQEEEKTTTVKLHSLRDGQNSLGQLYTRDETGEFCAIETINGERPEQALLTNYVSVYNRTRKMLKITAKQDSFCQPGSYWVDKDKKNWLLIAQTKSDWRSGISEYFFEDL